MTERSDPRTLLERLIQESDRTVEEHCADFERCARERNERGATLSVRQLGRWMAGQVDSARPASGRVALHLWGHNFKTLLGPPDIDAVGPKRATTPASAISIIPQGEVLPAAGTHPAQLQEEIAMAADEAARFVRRAGVVVTPELVQQFDADVRGLASEYLRRPPYAIFRPLAALRGDLFNVIDRHPRPEYLSDLYRVAGQLSALLAHASSDLGQPYAADSHARTAWICADLAGDRGLGAYIRWIQSNIAYWRGSYRDAAEIAQNGRAISVSQDDQLRLSSQEARATAAMQDGHGADRVLRVAADTRARMTEGASSLPGAFYFGPGKAAYYASEARLSLGGDHNIRQAVVDAEEALELLRSTPGREDSAELVAAAQLDLVAALLALGDLDGAGDRIQAALRLPSESRTVPVVGRIEGIYRTLGGESFEGVTLADDVREQIALFKAYSAMRELPQLPPAQGD